MRFECVSIHLPIYVTYTTEVNPAALVDVHGPCLVRLLKTNNTIQYLQLKIALTAAKPVASLPVPSRNYEIRIKTVSALLSTELLTAPVPVTRDVPSLFCAVYEERRRKMWILRRMVLLTGIGGRCPYCVRTIRWNSGSSSSCC